MYFFSLAKDAAESIAATENKSSFFIFRPFPYLKVTTAPIFGRTWYSKPFAVSTLLE